VIIGKLIPAGTGFTLGRFKAGPSDGSASQWTEVGDGSAAV